VRQTFVIAQSEQDDGAELIFSPSADSMLTEAQGEAFGGWLLQNGSTSFLRGLQEVMHEAEIDKKVGLGY
jgi:hypothetical protein